MYSTQSIESALVGHVAQIFLIRSDFVNRLRNALIVAASTNKTKQNLPSLRLRVSQVLQRLCARSRFPTGTQFMPSGLSSTTYHLRRAHMRARCMPASTLLYSNIAWQNEMELVELLFRHSSPRPELSWLSSGICLKNKGVSEQHRINTRSVPLNLFSGRVLLVSPFLFLMDIKASPIPMFVLQLLSIPGIWQEMPSRVRTPLANGLISG